MKTIMGKSKRIKRLVCVVMILFITAIALTACSGGSSDSTDTYKVADESDSSDDSGSGTTEDSDPVTDVITDINYDSEDLVTDYDETTASRIVLADDTISFTGDGAVVNGSTVTINSAGSYLISGKLTDGQIIVDAGDDDLIYLVFMGITLHCSHSSPVYVVNSGKVVITLKEGTDNYLSDGDVYRYDNSDETEPSATLYSKDDLVINGKGSLTVDANYNNAITGKDDLLIVSGTITVDSPADGIIGKDSLSILDGEITVLSLKEGLKSTEDDDEDAGYIIIKGGTVNITSDENGIAAETSIFIKSGTVAVDAVENGIKADAIEISGGAIDITAMEDGFKTDALTTVNGGEITIKTTGNDTDSSSHGISSEMKIVINDGSIDITAYEDGLNAVDLIQINGGTVKIDAGDDGINSDTQIEINNGTVEVEDAFEGIESPVITVNDGSVSATASDDGFNVSDSDLYRADGLYINGGYVFVDSGGDGLDSNAFLGITGGTVIVNGPIMNDNSALDYNMNCEVSGGTLIAVGSSTMAQAPGSNSTQNSFMFKFGSNQAAGTLVSAVDENGTALFSFSSTKTFQSLVFSSPDLEDGATYSMYTGGSTDGTSQGGLYLDGSYTPGTLLTTFTTSGTVTVVSQNGSPGDIGGGIGGGGMGGWDNRPR